MQKMVNETVVKNKNLETEMEMASDKGMCRLSVLGALDIFS